MTVKADTPNSPCVEIFEKPAAVENTNTEQQNNLPQEFLNDLIAPAGAGVNEGVGVNQGENGRVSTIGREEVGVNAGEKGETTFPGRERWTESGWGEKENKDDIHLIPSLDGERIFGRATTEGLARKVEVGRYSADTPNNPRQGAEGGWGDTKTDTAEVIETVETLENVEASDTYDVTAEKDATLDLSGYTISNIEILGLKNLNPDLIYNCIKSQRGSFFNEEILQKDLQQIYALGYFTDKIEIEPELFDDNTVNLKFVLQENPCVNDVRVMGNSTIQDEDLAVFVKDLKGRPQNVQKLNEAIEKINNHYHSNGYILAAVDAVTDDEEGILTLGINEGVINKIYFEGNKKTKDFVLERNILTVPGTVYNEEYLKRDITELYSTNIFKEVDRVISPSTEVDGAYDVKIVVKESSSNSISLGGGIDNALGGFGSLTFTENNLFGRGQRLSLSGILGSGILLSDSSIKNRMNYQFELNFFEPYFLNADNSLMGKVYYRELGSYNVPLAIERRVAVMGGVEHKVKGFNHLSTTFTGGIEHIYLKEGDSSKISELYNLRGLDIRERAKELNGGTFLNLSPGVRYSTLDTEVNPRDGIIASANLMEALCINDFNRTNGRVAGSVSKYFPVGKKSSFSLTAKGGIKAHGDHMPEVMAFRLGGPYSIRGFKMNGVGTGDAFLMGSAELATPLPFVDRLKWDFIKTLRVTFFVDAGKVFDGTIASVLYDRPMEAISAGVGLRLYIPNVGPVSVNYGVPFTNVGSYGSKHGYFTFGTGVNGYGW